MSVASVSLPEIKCSLCTGNLCYTIIVISDVTAATANVAIVMANITILIADVAIVRVNVTFCHMSGYTRE